MARTQKNAPDLTTAQQLSSSVKSWRDITGKDKGLNADLDRLPMLTWIMFGLLADASGEPEEAWKLKPRLN